MQITTKNYFTEVSKLNFDALPARFGDWMKEGKVFANDVTDGGRDWTQYDTNQDIKDAVDRYVRNVNSLYQKQIFGSPEKLKTAAKPKAQTLQKQIEKLTASVKKKKSLVAQNARFKTALSSELENYFAKQGMTINPKTGNVMLATGLGNAPALLLPEVQIARLKVQDKFYGGLIKGDLQDFTTVAKRIGLSFRKATVRKKK